MPQITYFVPKRDWLANSHVDVNGIALHRVNKLHLRPSNVRSHSKLFASANVINLKISTDISEITAKEAHLCTKEYISNRRLRSRRIMCKDPTLLVTYDSGI